MRLFRPQTVTEALDRVEGDPDGARFYAGGLEVVSALRAGTLTCSSLIDTKRLEGAVGVSRAVGDVRIGPATRHHVIATDPIVSSQLPLLGIACAQVGTIRIRMQGTIGGNFGHGHQHTDPGTASIIHGGYVDLVSAAGRRSVAIEDYWIGPYTVASKPGELIESLRVQPLGPGWTAVHDRVEHLHRPPTAIVSMAARVVGGEITECRIAVGAVPPRPLRVPVLERLLLGCRAHDAVGALAPAERVLREVVVAETDLLGSAEFKVAMLAGLVRRGVRQLIDRQGGPNQRM